MSVNRLTKLLLQFSEKQNSVSYKILSLFMGSIVFLILIPLLFIYLGQMVENQIHVEWPVLMRRIIVGFHIPFGLFFLCWATYSHWKFGEGTPVQNAPTQKLVVNGPYKLCRNPIRFGVILYYLGVGTLAATITTGFVSLLLGFICGTLYHKYIEEKELELRFGDEYVQYKKNTPFLFPKIWRLFYKY